MHVCHLRRISVPNGTIRSTRERVLLRAFTPPFIIAVVLALALDYLIASRMMQIEGPVEGGVRKAKRDLHRALEEETLRFAASSASAAAAYGSGVYSKFSIT